MKNIVIAIAGASGSGKTYLSNLISNKFKNSVVLNQDNYYIPKPDLTKQKRDKLNFDRPSMLEWKLLINHINSLRDNKPIDAPIYSFKTHIRLEETKKINPRKIIILEGLFALYSPKINNISNLKIYMNTHQDLCFLRRLKRDISERNRTVESVINQYLQTVRPAFHRYILPTKNNADIILNGKDDHRKIFARIKQLLEDY